MKLCSYVVKTDAGLAPNPFWGYCTLAVCTPNHMGIKAQPGDWYLGITPKSFGEKIVYAMRVSETLSFEEYDTDVRFEAKKPIMKAPWKQRCGDNLYYRDENGVWQQRPNPYHDTDEFRKKDLRHPTVFISQHFFYFGENAVDIPQNCLDLLWRRQGCKCSHDPRMVESFIAWLESTYATGIHGEPRDRFKSQTTSK